ncbi:EAL domain-containing response regulator [Aquabacterium humicola]|uniref:EAL domain-containing response regulator n=1 Tax=Aquabacterium humicola TaxID=3237377 RepID=UPI002542CC7B|nr:EAL domain-containing response regulator [Rubrivivax pictus]
MTIALVVEDSGVQRRHMVGLLVDLGYEQVLQAANGHEALQTIDAAAQPSIELVVTDIDMPGMDGIELIGRLAQRRDVGHLIVTSARDPRLLETVECLAGAHPAMPLLGAVTKPVSRERLAQLLEGIRAGRGRAPAGATVAAGLPEIEAALDARQFEPFVQPKVALATGLLHGVEALARWRHPERGVLGPAHFIDAIEGTPLMARFTLQIVERALAHWRNWARALPGLKLSINLSADDLVDPTFVGQLMDRVHQHGVPPAALIWEVTESMLMRPPAMGSLARLGLKGCGLSIDDFGTGYSSMQTLSRSPFTELKIDRSFVDGASERANRRAILDSALALGRQLGISTVAEGVETEADWQLLRTLRCDLAQGYFIARPMPAAELLPWLRANRARLRQLAPPATIR